VFYKRSVALAAAFTVTVALPVLTAADAGAINVPWTVQTVFALAPDDSYVAEWNGPGAGWTIIGGPASAVYAGSAGVFATSPSTGDIWMYNGTPGSWTEIGGPGAQFAEGGGHLYGLGPNSTYVAEWNGPGSGWTVIGGAAGEIEAGPYGLVATAPGAGGDIWRYNGTPGNWTEIGGPPSSSAPGSLAVGADGVYRVNPTDAAGNTVVDKWAGGTTWSPILTVGSGTEVSNLVVGDDGEYLWKSTPTAKGFFAYNGSPNNWTQITTIDADNAGLFASVESATSLYGVTLDHNIASTNVEIYSGSGSSWTVIGGPADPALAAGG
jgi:hypothetical protein